MKLVIKTKHKNAGNDDYWLKRLLTSLDFESHRDDIILYDGTEVVPQDDLYMIIPETSEAGSKFWEDFSNIERMCQKYREIIIEYDSSKDLYKIEGYSFDFEFARRVYCFKGISHVKEVKHFSKFRVGKDRRLEPVDDRSNTYGLWLQHNMTLAMSKTTGVTLDELQTTKYSWFPLSHDGDIGIATQDVISHVLEKPDPISSTAIKQSYILCDYMVLIHEEKQQEDEKSNKYVHRLCPIDLVVYKAL